jgi:hypothetical protein
MDAEGGGTEDTSPRESDPLLTRVPSLPDTQTQTTLHSWAAGRWLAVSFLTETEMCRL